MSDIEQKEAADHAEETGNHKKLWKFFRIISIIFLILWVVYFLYLVIDPKNLHPEYRLHVGSTLLRSFIQLLKWFVAVALIYVVLYTQVLRKK